MNEASSKWRLPRRSILGIAAAILGSGQAAATSTEAIRADADNIVAGNDRLTITLDGVTTDEIESVSVVVDGVAFARVDVLEREKPVLMINPSNLAESERLVDRTIVAVDVRVTTAEQSYLGSDIVQVVRET